MQSKGTDLLERPKIRLFYAGDMGLARPQFASDAPDLELLAVNEAAIGEARAKGTVPPVDVAFIDCTAPGVNAPRLVEELRRAFPGLPIVVAVDPGRDGSAREAVDLRADDYTVKSPRWLARLPVRLGMVIHRHRRINESEGLRLQEERLRLIIESAPVCLTRISRDGAVLAINTAGRAIIGADSGRAVLTKSILPFVDASHQEALLDFIQRVCGGLAGSTEFSVIGADSESGRAVEAHAIPLPPRSGRAETALLVLRDVTARRRLEESLEDAAPVATGTAVADLENRLGEIELQCRRLTEERDELAHTVEDANATLDALAARFEQRGLELNSVTAERNDLSSKGALGEASAERDRLKRILAEALARYQNLPAAASTGKEDI